MPCLQIETFWNGFTEARNHVKTALRLETRNFEKLTVESMTELSHNFRDLVLNFVRTSLSLQDVHSVSGALRAGLACNASLLALFLTVYTGSRAGS